MCFKKINQRKEDEIIFEYKELLNNLDPPLSAKSKWVDVRARIQDDDRFRAVPPIKRKVIFDALISSSRKNEEKVLKSSKQALKVKLFYLNYVCIYCKKFIFIYKFTYYK